MIIASGFNHGLSTNAKLNEPSTEIWTIVGNMNVDRFLHTASVLTNARVLVTGGTSHANTLHNAELFSPSAVVLKDLEILARYEFSRICKKNELLSNGYKSFPLLISIVKYLILTTEPPEVMPTI